MSFSMQNCTVLKQNKRRKGRKCFGVINIYDYCLTENVKKGLQMWLEFKFKTFGCNRFTSKEIEQEIAELLRLCCNKSRVQMITKADVRLNEIKILYQIKYSIESRKMRGIYSPNNEINYEELYQKQKVVTSVDLLKYLEGVKIYD